MLHIILRKYLRSNANQWFAWSFLESKMDGNSKLNVLLYSVLFTVHFSIVTVYKNHRENVPGNIMYDLRSFRKTSNSERATSRSLRPLDRQLLLWHAKKFFGDKICWWRNVSNDDIYEYWLFFDRMYNFKSKIHIILKWF